MNEIPESEREWLIEALTQIIDKTNDAGAIVALSDIVDQLEHPAGWRSV